MLEGMDLKGLRLALDFEGGRILSLVSSEPKTAKEISQILKIPLTRCYRQLRALEQYNLITRNKKRKRGELYMSNLWSFKIIIDHTKFSHEIVFNDGRRRIIEFEMGCETE
jgi:DNA-binding transcriptional regulator GbsR (MarR family)